ncbi:MAG: hypothetical protein IJZ37_00920 [Clostridia bacterium]|nr:hypothetical protein [Clostridia bacterium]MBQ8235228.1 hypothetical protein [Clostridia bacterium]MBQ8399162.1 hypothetical protein [Clostridia bacterium]
MEKYHSKRIVKWIAGIVAMLVFLGALAGILEYGRIAEEEKKAQLAEMDAQAKPYVIEMESLRLKIEMIQREITELERTGTKMSMMVFNQCASNLYDEVYLYAQNTQSSSVFVVSGAEMIGKQGCISLAQYDELLSKEWVCAVGAPGKDQSLQEYLLALRGQFEALDRPFPTAYYFEKGMFTEENLNMLKEEGFQTFFYDISEPYIEQVDQTMTTLEDPVYISYMYASANLKIWSEYSQRMEAGDSCAIATRYAMRSGEFMSGGRADPQYDTVSTNLLDMYETLRHQYDYYRTLRAYREELYASYVDVVLQKQELLLQIEGIKEKREELNGIISDIYAGKKQ